MTKILLKVTVVKFATSQWEKKPADGQVDSPESPETPELTEMTENFTKVTKYLTKLKETLINYDWEKSHLIK